MFTIGEFSKITGLTVKTLRFYHDRGLLAPAWIDEQTGYRYYNICQADKARVIAQLRTLEFSIEAIGRMLAECEDEVDILDFLERQRVALVDKMREYRGIVTTLEKIIHDEREARMTLQNSTFAIEEKLLPTLLIAGVRMQGRYRNCGQGFAKIGKAFGRHIAGHSFMLHYDTEFKEEDADFEACMPVRKSKAVDGISVRELAGGRCLSLLHKGPYEELGRTYARILKHIQESGEEIRMPTRELYLKGPGIIFKGNPKNYLTEIQILVADKVTSSAQ